MESWVVEGVGMGEIYGEFTLGDEKGMRGRELKCGLGSGECRIHSRPLNFL